MCDCQVLVPDLSASVRAALAGAEVERKRIFREVVGPLVEALEYWLPDESLLADHDVPMFYKATAALAKAREELAAERGGR